MFFLGTSYKDIILHRVEQRINFPTRLSKPSHDMAFSIVEYCGEHSSYQCGYCKQSSSCHSYGMWAHKLSCLDYQELIDRGWRRSGCYCYKPMMDVTCCPSYTIKCDAMNFRLNKSHKKIIKRMHKFLRDGKQEPTERTILSNSDETASQDTSTHEHMEVPCVQPKPLDASLMGLLTSANDEHHPVGDAEGGTSGLHNPNLPETLNVSLHSSDSNVNNQPKKAKVLRIERKREKLQKKGLSEEAIEQMMKPSGKQNQEKMLEDFLAECPQENETPKHRLQVKCVVASEGATSTTFKLYSLYQQSIHKDPASKLSMDRFKRFLVKSPLKVNIAVRDVFNLVSLFFLFSFPKQILQLSNRS